jgi:predicted sulfurtransferase
MSEATSNTDHITDGSSNEPQDRSQQHTAVVLFYKYFVAQDDGVPLLIQQFSDHYVGKLQQFCKELCVRLSLKGRILIAPEGINGTVSATDRETLQQFIIHMEAFDLVRDFELVSDDGSFPATECLFQGIDWKLSSKGIVSSKDDSSILEPFPDLKVSIVKEIISTGGTVSVDDVRDKGGTHLSPAEFHQCILDHPDAVIIDVRNTFEHAIGHFVNPSTEQPATNPETVTFSSFDATFCTTNAETLKDKKVLMYCTGGIRCEKASVMLKKRGVVDVSQLSGGIHRYLETYGDAGFFRGKNFVFDQRVAQKPSDCCPQRSTKGGDDVVGKCIECSVAFDEICGSRVCTVCRDLVLVCPTCRTTLREYHCARHAAWKTCYFTFVDVFDRDELATQHCELLKLRDTFLPASQHKNVRRTLSRQIEKVATRKEMLDAGRATVDRNAPRRCRTCRATNDVCDGRCWGFWKTHAPMSNVEERSPRDKPDVIVVGDQVEPGPDWNELRLGSRFDASGNLLHGTVMEIKTWGAGGAERDCVAVCWNQGTDSQTLQPLIYRWGVLALNGQRMYDLQLRLTKR